MDGRHGSGHVKTSQLALLHPSVLWQKLRIPLSGRGAVDGAGATESHSKRTQLLAIMQPKHKNETRKKYVVSFAEFSRSFSLSWTCFLISTAPSRKHGLVASHQFLLLLCSTGGKSAGSCGIDHEKLGKEAMSYLSLRGHFLVTSNANRLATIHDFFVKL